MTRVMFPGRVCWSPGEGWTDHPAGDPATVVPTATTLPLMGHAPDDQRHRVLVSFPSLAAADAALTADRMLTYGGVRARRVVGLAADWSVMVTSHRRYYGERGPVHMAADVARVMETLATRAGCTLADG